MAVTDKRNRNNSPHETHDANCTPGFIYEEQEGEMVDVTSQAALEKIDYLADVKIDGGDWTPSRCNAYTWRNGTTEQKDTELENRVGSV